MRVVRLKASLYRSLRDVEITFDQLNLLIGGNASGKSNVLDALRFLAEGVDRVDFEEAVGRRGSVLHLAWKGEEAHDIGLEVKVEDGKDTYAWKVEIERRGHHEFRVLEHLYGPGAEELLRAKDGRGWWRSGNGKGQKTIDLSARGTGCALSAASIDAGFPARRVAEFVRSWRFFDPNPASMRRASSEADGPALEHSGRNLAARLYALSQHRPKVFEQILSATRGVLGLPENIEFSGPDPEGRVFFMQREPDLHYRVHQIGASSGTLRMLALMAALYGEADAGLVGIEEPENYVHPTAIAAFAEFLRETSKKVQVIATTHSPLLLDAVGLPEAVRIIHRSPQGTTVTAGDAQAVGEALRESGLGLGEFHETKGFGL